MRLILSTIISLAVLATAGSHKVHLNRQHSEVAKRMSGDVSLEKRFDGSKWSYYDAQTGNQGACGGFIGNGDFVVALNVAQWDGGSHCGQTITMRYGGKTAQAVIRDQCPGCPWGGLDLTPSLFAYFDSHDKGIIYGAWDFGGGDPTPAPTTTYEPPPPTTTWSPPPPTSPTTTWSPPPPTTTYSPPPPPPSSSAAPSSSSLPSSSAPASSSSASASASGANRPTESGVVSGNRQTQSVLSDLTKAFVAIGNVNARGAGVAAANN